MKRSTLRRVREVSRAPTLAILVGVGFVVLGASVPTTPLPAGHSVVRPSAGALHAVSFPAEAISADTAVFGMAVPETSRARTNTGSAGAAGAAAPSIHAASLAGSLPRGRGVSRVDPEGSADRALARAGRFSAPATAPPSFPS